MNTLLKVPFFLIVFSFFLLEDVSIKSTQETTYQKNLKIAADLYLENQKIPEAVLLKLVPKNYTEFLQYYETTGPDHRLAKTDFFYKTTLEIFEQVTRWESQEFYAPSIQLASFANGEYAETFIEYLDQIIRPNTNAFCETTKGKDYVNRNPVKYYRELHRCR